MNKDAGTSALAAAVPPPSAPPSSAPDAAPRSDLAAAIARLSRANVLVVGDAMLDRYVFGTVGRISPEAPIPVLLETRELSEPGGAGNVVHNLCALGAAVAFVSVVGDDQAGSDLTALIGGQPGVEPWLLVQGGRVTTQKTRFVAGETAEAGQQMLRADREDARPIHPKLAERMLRIAGDAMAATTVTVLSDYRKGVLAGDVPAQLIATAHATGRRIVADIRGGAFERYAGADLVVPHGGDLAQATGLPTETDAELQAAAQTLRERHGFGAVLAARAEGGLILAGAEGVRLLRGHPAQASGAADAAIAALAAALAVGFDLPFAAQLAARALGLPYPRVGTAVLPQGGLLDD